MEGREGEERRKGMKGRREKGLMCIVMENIRYK